MFSQECLSTARTRSAPPTSIPSVVVLPATLPGGAQARPGNAPGIGYQKDPPTRRHRLGEQRRTYRAVGLLYYQVTLLGHLGKTRARFAQDEGLDGIEPAPLVKVPEDVVLHLLMPRGPDVVKVAEE